VSERPSRAKRVIAGFYSRAAEKIYDPLIVNGAFKVFGGKLNDLALEQGRRAVASAEGRPILDMPVGTAFFTVQIAAGHDGLVVGADIASGMVREAARVARRSGTHNVAALQADVHHLPFADGTFGAVLCTNGLQVIPGLVPSVQELTRVLAPGATIYTSVLTLPVSRLLPQRAGAHLPTMFRSGGDVAEALSDAGVYITGMKRERFATLIEAVKPV
jgi:SAM-dependent methyltransferase